MTSSSPIVRSSASRALIELVEKASYYLAHEDERERIRRAGMERARRDHTWQARFQQVFAEIGLP